MCVIPTSNNFFKFSYFEKIIYGEHLTIYAINHAVEVRTLDESFELSMPIMER